jgi:hypothetical protein
MKKSLIVMAVLMIVFTSCVQENDPAPVSEGEQIGIDLKNYLRDNPDLKVFFCYEYDPITGNWKPINDSSSSTEGEINYSFHGKYFTFETSWGGAKESFNLEYLVRFEHSGSQMRLYFVYPNQ